MKNVTIKEIAKMAGVSPTAVSFVINGKEGVSDDTRRRVNEIIARTGFVPSISSRRLLMKRSFNIGVLLSTTSSPFEDLFYFEIMKGILKKSRVYGYNIVISEIRDGALPDIIRANDTDGIIFLQDIDECLLSDIAETRIPFIVVDSHTADDRYTSVMSDYVLAAYTATRHLIENGHRRIAFMTSSFVPDFCTQTCEGFERAMSEAGLTCESALMKTDMCDEAMATAAMEEILVQKNPPTALMSAVDTFAIGAAKAVRERGLRIPDDISLIGIDDILLDAYIEPGLTTIKLDKLLMGELAMEMIVKKIEGEAVESVTIRSDELIIRNSVKKA